MTEHRPCQGDADGSWLHCMCHDDTCLHPAQWMADGAAIDALKRVAPGFRIEVINDRYTVWHDTHGYRRLVGEGPTVAIAAERATVTLRL